MTNLEWLTNTVLERGTTNSECIVWPHYRNKDGYGEVGVEGSKKRVHRVSYELVFGNIPSDLEIDHKCRNRACFNPKCLRAITHSKNMVGVKNQNTNRTHCQRGHEFTKENTYIFPDGRRCCKACRAVSFAKFKAKIEGGGESNS
jgi:hypothetical protein